MKGRKGEDGKVVGNRTYRGGNRTYILSMNPPSRPHSALRCSSRCATRLHWAGDSGGVALKQQAACMNDAVRGADSTDNVDSAQGQSVKRERHRVKQTRLPRGQV